MYDERRHVQEKTHETIVSTPYKTTQSESGVLVVVLEKEKDVVVEDTSDDLMEKATGVHSFCNEARRQSTREWPTLCEMYSE